MVITRHLQMPQSIITVTLTFQTAGTMCQAQSRNGTDINNKNDFLYESRFLVAYFV